MSRTLRILSLLLLTALVAPPPPAAGQDAYGTPGEAQALLERAIAYYREVGRETAMRAINDKDGPFIDRDLYVWVVDFDLVVQAHGANNALVGKDMSRLKDVNGTLVTQGVLRAAQNHPEGGWSSYVWTNPATRKLEPKRAWSKIVDDLIFVTGVYSATPR